MYIAQDDKIILKYFVEIGVLSKQNKNKDILSTYIGHVQETACGITYSILIGSVISSVITNSKESLLFVTDRDVRDIRMNIPDKATVCVCAIQ